MNILTLRQNQFIKVARHRNLQNLTISYEDRELLFDIKEKNKYLFDIKKEIKINSFVGVVELKSGLLIEVLPNFTKELTLFDDREKFLNMVLLNFKNSNYLFSKLDLRKFPLSEALIYLFANALSNELIKLNRDFFENEKLALSIFKASIYLLSQNHNLSYLTKYMLNGLLESLEEIGLIHIDLNSFEDDKLKDSYFSSLLAQLKFIMREFIPFADSNLEYWKIVFDLNTLFKEFITYLFHKNKIEFNQKRIPLFDTNIIEFDFLIKESDGIDKLVEVSWNFDEEILKEIFIYMSLKDIDSYLILPKEAVTKENITFINSKRVQIIKIDFSLSFNDLLDTTFNFNQDVVEVKHFSNFDSKKDLLSEWFYKNGINIEANNLRNLQKLKLTKSIDSIPDEFELLNLNSLEILNTNLREIPQSVIDNLTSLKELSIKNNFNLAKLPTFNNLKELRVISICDNASILIEIPNYLYNFYNLEKIDFSNNSLTTLNILKPMDNLKELIVANNSIETYSLKCDNLETFDISNNTLTYIFELPLSLKELNFSSNKLKAVTPIVTNLINLVKFDISGNDIRILPDEIGNLENLVELNLSYNRLTELPKSIEKLINLEYIYLSGNYFSKFPNEIIKLMMINRNLKVIIEKEEFKKSIPYYLFERVL